VIPQLLTKCLHVLILKSEGIKFPRNPNAHILELFCSTYFYGPLVVATNSIEKPYSLDSFSPVDLQLLRDNNNKVHRVYPPPFEGSYPSLTVRPVDQLVDPITGGNSGIYSEAFYMTTYKTAYCPNIAKKHDWTQCIYAHRFTDYRRNPQYFQYQPEECPHLDPET